MHRYKDLKVWIQSVNLAKGAYEITSSFSEKEKFGLVNQVNRCAVSVASNIAEGAGRNTDKEFNQFLGIATGSLFELETQLIISKNIEYISESDLIEIQQSILEITKMISGLKSSLKLD